jgi:hypothetical protein
MAPALRPGMPSAGLTTGSPGAFGSTPEETIMFGDHHTNRCNQQ